MIFIIMIILAMTLFQDLYWDHGDGPVNYDNYGNALVYGKDWGCRFRDLVFVK